MNFIENPFFLKELWIWRREMPYFEIKGIRLIFLLTILLAFFLDCFIRLIFGWHLGSALKSAWNLAVIFWIILLSWFSVTMALEVYHREREFGTFHIASMTKISPIDEVFGRLAGALIPVFEGWLSGLILVFSTIIIFFDFHKFIASLSSWLFVAFWCAALSALALLCSILFRTFLGSILGFFSSFVMITLINSLLYLVFIKLSQPYLSFINLSPWGFAMPLNPLAFFIILTSSFPSAAVFLHIFLWTPFILVLVKISSYFVSKGIIINQMLSESSSLFGFIPVIKIKIFPSKLLRRWFVDVELFRKSLPQRFGKNNWVLFIFKNNPFLVAYRRVFTRLYRGRLASCGSLISPIIVISGTIVYCIAAVSGEIPHVVAFFLVVCLLSSLTIILFESIGVGLAMIRAERNRSSWPLLVVTGILPEQLLWGKFITSFYALSGVWLYTIPFWFLASLCGLKIKLLTLILFQPIVTALGIMIGLWAGCQPRYLILNPKKILLQSILLSFIFVVVKIIHPSLFSSALILLRDIGNFLDPFSSMLAIVSGIEKMMIDPTVNLFCQLGVLTGIVFLYWHSSKNRLKRVMLEE